MEQLESYTATFWDYAVQYAPRFLMALVVLIVGIIIINSFTRLMGKAISKRNLDVSLKTFLMSLVNILFKALLLISVAQMLGVETTSFVAIVGAAGLAVGLALQGSLANFAGGVLILLFRPYKVGDFIDAQGQAGTVNAIHIFNTVLKTPGNVTIIIPNGAISSGTITNFSTEAQRRVDFTFGIGYDDDIDKAKSILSKMASEDERVLKDPEPFIAVSELADSSVNFVVRLWVNAPDYWAVHFDWNENVKKAFDANKISIPFPQRDVHVFNN